MFFVIVKTVKVGLSLDFYILIILLIVRATAHNVFFIIDFSLY